MSNKMRYITGKKKPSDEIRDIMAWEREITGKSLSYQTLMEIKINAIIAYLDAQHLEKQVNRESLSNTNKRDRA